MSRQNFPALNGLRGLAILGVLLWHGTGNIPEGGPVHRIWVAAMHCGWAGVDLFFVLSGFLITGILVDTRSCSNYWQSFYMRRALRIFPLYYTFLLVSLTLFPLIVQADWIPAARDRWLYVTYLMNWQVLWTEPGHANVLGHFWSLCVEEQFYLVWPWIILTMPPRRLIYILAGAEVTLVAIRSTWVLTHGYNIMFNTATVTRMDGLLVGSLCALLLRQDRMSNLCSRVLPFVGFTSLAAFVVGLEGYWRLPGLLSAQAFGFGLLALGFGAILLWAVMNEGKGGLQVLLRWEPLTRLGKYSYGIYVFHVPIYYFVNRALPISGISGTSLLVDYMVLAVKISISYLIASLSYNLFERRILAYKDRFHPQYPKSVPKLATATSWQ